MRKIKILISLNNTRISGIERFVLLLSKYLNKSIYDLVIAVPSNGQICKSLTNLNINYYIFNNSDIKPYNIIGILNLFKLFTQNKFDIVHAQAGIVPCILGKIFRVKLILEHKHGLDFTDEQLQNFGIFRLTYEKVKKYFVDYTLTVCEKDKNTLIEYFNYLPSKVITVYNSIEMDAYRNRIEDKNIKSKIVIGTIGRLTFQKGQEYFIEMADLLLKENTNINFRFEIYGNGENMKKYSNLIDDLGLSNCVFLLDYSENVTKVLRSFDIFVLTSRYEGIPFVIIEAMSAKLPIVSTNVGGISEVIKNNVNGILVNKENPKELKDAVLKLLNDKSFCNNIRINAYEDYKKNWTIEKTIAKLEMIYNYAKKI